MNVELPTSIECDVERYAQEAHLSTDEAVAQLVKDGLRQNEERPKSPAEEGRGMFSSPEDAALMDYVIQSTYEDRGYIPRGSVKD